jgi:MFS family permease
VGAAGLVAGAQGVGTVAAALVVARRGTTRRIGVGAAIGLYTAALGIAAIAIAPVTAAAVAGGVIMGIGSGAFACHVGPLVLAGTPRTHLSRTQALLTLVQSLALVVTDNVLGALADTAGAEVTTVVCATVVCAAGTLGLASKPLRRLS